MTVSRYLVTGANGFVGHLLCQQLVEMGIPVRAALRSALMPPIANVEQVFVGNINERTDWITALNGIGVVIHLAARVHIMQDDASDPLTEFRRTNTAGTETLARSAASAGVKRLVYVSSIKVNGESTSEGNSFRESDEENPHDPYGKSKWEAEQILYRVSRETGMEVVVLRPPLVYGPGVKGNFLQMLHMIVRGIPLPLSSVRNSRDFIYVGNLVDALVTCAAHPKVVAQTYLVSDGERISTPKLLRELATMLGVPARIFPCPTGLLRSLGRMTGRTAQLERLLGSLQVNSAKIHQDVGWNPPYSLRQGLQLTADWYKSEHP